MAPEYEAGQPRSCHSDEPGNTEGGHSNGKDNRSRDENTKVLVSPQDSPSTVSRASSPAPGVSPSVRHSPSPPPPAVNPTETMASVGPRRPKPPKKEVNLSQLLTADQKNDLVQLVTRISEAMQRQLCRTFDYSDADTTDSASRRPWHLLFPSSLKDTSLSLRRKERRNTAPDNEIDESHEPRLVELKKEALLAFRKWQGAVLKRVGDISTKCATAKPGNSYALVASTTAKGPLTAMKAGSAPKKRDPKSTISQVDAALVQIYPPTATPLSYLPIDKRTLLFHSMLLLLLSLEHYSPNSRILLLHLASSLHIAPHVLANDEVRVANGLSEMVKDVPAEELVRKKPDEGRSSRRWKAMTGSSASASVAGGVVGLAAPLAAVGIGTILGGATVGDTAAAALLGAVCNNALAVGSLFGVYSTRTAGRIMDQCTREIQDFAFLSMHESVPTEYRDARNIASHSRRLRVTVCINGWLGHADDVLQPWRAIGDRGEVFALRWEVESLTKMGNALETVVRSAAWSLAKREIASQSHSRTGKDVRPGKPATESYPVLAALVESTWPMGLLKVSKILDNPWSTCMVRADKAGVMLADAIINKVQGERGVTLIGFSLGARVIYTCLMTLAERRQFGLVEASVLIGAPAPSKGRIWSIMKSVVTGRLVNVYSENDYLLGFLYRTSSTQYGVAGLQAVDGGFGVENFDASDMISGHLRYRYLVSNILKHISWEDIDLDQVAKDRDSLAIIEAKARESESEREPECLKVDAMHIW